MLPIRAVALGIFRFLSNFGLGGEVPVTLTLASEFSPGRMRGRMAGNIMAAFPVGLVIAAGLSLFIIPRWGWRALFVVGVLPAALLFFVRRYMPESVRYLLSKGPYRCSGKNRRRHRAAIDRARKGARGDHASQICLTVDCGRPGDVDGKTKSPRPAGAERGRKC